MREGVSQSVSELDCSWRLIASNSPPSLPPPRSKIAESFPDRTEVQVSERQPETPTQTLALTGQAPNSVRAQ